MLQAALRPGGVVDGVTPGKAYVDMSTVDEATSQQIAAAINAKGGRFLEVRLQRLLANLAIGSNDMLT
jgi:glyoxylate/succinic semialdehyde reductase